MRNWKIKLFTNNKLNQFEIELDNLKSWNIDPSKFDNYINETLHDFLIDNNLFDNINENWGNNPNQWNYLIFDENNNQLNY